MSNARKLVLLAVAVLLVGGLVYFLFGWGNETETETAEQIAPAPAPLTISTSSAPTTIDITEDPDTEAAENITRQALSVAFTWYPATDRSPTDGYARAREWFTDTLAQTLLVDTHTERGPGAQWNQWASDNAKVVADVTLGCSGCPPDTDALIQRVASIHQTAITENETNTVTTDTTVWVTLTKGGDQWRLDTIHY
ncbi:hypothetical protein LRQ08_31535 (plasmid) [Rhodococcus qingshengii]|uniref:hypothetical protein n=1 Tax=Rhodococcus qingshengii TaxID=334542 RepID=UPI002112EE82|nr:hypothetical protein [Rhodococcus qingshengii]UUE28470.1 hypothetical protein LRQ08_31535 [Rhodococcus qingshengii]